MYFKMNRFGIEQVAPALSQTEDRHKADGILLFKGSRLAVDGLFGIYGTAVMYMHCSTFAIS